MISLQCHKYKEKYKQIVCENAILKISNESLIGRENQDSRRKSRASQKL